MKRNSKDFTDNQHNDTPSQETPAEELHLENPDVEAMDVDPEEDGMAEVAEDTSELESLRARLQTKEEEVAKEKKE